MVVLSDNNETVLSLKIFVETEITVEESVKDDRIQSQWIVGGSWKIWTGIWTRLGEDFYFIFSEVL